MERSKPDQYKDRSMWETMVKACHSSGQEVATWCKENQVNYRAYYYRQGMLNKSRKKAEQSRHVDFVALEPMQVDIVEGSKGIENQADSPSRIQIKIGAASITVDTGVDQLTLATVLKVVHAVC